MLIPILSSIIPIYQVVKVNLNDALDYQRSKTQAVYVQVLSKNKKNITSFLLFGIIACIYGLSIYYLLPLSLISLNFTMILRIFLFILVGILFALSLLALNSQTIMEKIFTHVFLVFEQKSMKQMVLKNLTAHRMRNRLTSIIYSLALGFIIFLIVTHRLINDSNRVL